jgi:hypothetical protein
MAYEPLTYEGRNLLTLIAVLALLAWFCDMCRRICRVWELSDGVSSGAVVRLAGLDSSFGELQLLWSTSLQQQILRSSRKCRGIAVSQVHVPWRLKPNSIRVVKWDEGELDISLRYTATVGGTLQLFWGMEHAALERFVARFNRRHELAGDNRKKPSALPSRRRKRCGWFGARYTAVESREGGTEMLDLDGPVAGTSTISSEGADALFPHWECRGWTEPVVVSPGTDSTFAMHVALRPHRERGSGLVHAQEDTQKGGGHSSVRRGAGLVDEVETHSGSCADGPASLAGSIDSVGLADSSCRSAGRESDDPPDPFPLVMAVSVQELAKTRAPDDGSRFGRGDERQGGMERVLRVVFAIGSRQPTSSHLHVDHSIVITNRAAYLTRDVYGQQDDGDEEECIICLSHRKAITLLPCRHLCVCAKCMSRLELCPVCRSPFAGYLKRKEGCHDGEKREEQSLC